MFFQPFSFSSNINQVCLPTTVVDSLPDSRIGLGLTVQGWGEDSNGDTGKLLTQIDVSIRSNRECNHRYNNAKRIDKIRFKTFFPQNISEAQFCADSNLNLKKVGVCNGDSGGPALIRCDLETQYFQS